MAATDSATSAARPASGGSFRWIVAGGLARLVAWDARYRQRRHIARLEADRLRDCGMTRAEAAAEARKPFWAA